MMNTITTTYFSDQCVSESKPKTSKHLMERKRRARINDSLLQLKSLVFPTIRKEIARHPKLEKADILEMTVRHIQELQKRSVTGSSTINVSQFHAGFSECLSEVSRFLSNCENIELDTRLRILNHLADKCSTMPEPMSSAPTSVHQVQTTPTHHQHRRSLDKRHSPYGHQLESRRQMSPVSHQSDLLQVRVPPVQSTSKDNLVVVIPAETYSSHTVLAKKPSPKHTDLYPTPPQSPVEEIRPVETPEYHHHYSHSYARREPNKRNFSANQTVSPSQTRVLSPFPVNRPVQVQEPVWRPW